MVNCRLSVNWVQLRNDEFGFDDEWNRTAYCLVVDGLQAAGRRHLSCYRRVTGRLGVSCSKWGLLLLFWYDFTLLYVHETTQFKAVWFCLDLKWIQCMFLSRMVLSLLLLQVHMIAADCLVYFCHSCVLCFHQWRVVDGFDTEIIPGIGPADSYRRGS